MFGFRENLSTQDVLLQIKEETINTSPRAGENVIMALAIKGAFDNFSHEAIMEGLNNANCGKRIHDYVRAFLIKHTATVGLGDLRSDVFTTPRKGTPQGPVIPRILFNIAMIGLARRLSKIDGIQHAIYDDDITVRVNRGCLGQEQEKLQEAAEGVEEYVRERGIACSTEKSQILIVGRNPTKEELKVKLEGKTYLKGA
ncbi:putative nicotine oxidoreductase [Dermacentor variabilis]|uniref:putative nicotine oxidoreductase n=1 Tax=Dermacentor variabilis TaxID=34621 RepID=UPI003F5AFF43